MLSLYGLLSVMLCWVLARSKHITMIEFIIAFIVLSAVLLIETRVIFWCLSLNQVYPWDTFPSDRHKILIDNYITCIMSKIKDIYLFSSNM